MRIVVRRSAVADLDGISTYIKHQNPAAARRVAARIRMSVRRLSTFPFSGRRGEEPGTREVVVTGLPYVIVYRVVERPGNSFVEVTGVFHGARDRARDVDKDEAS